MAVGLRHRSQLLGHPLTNTRSAARRDGAIAKQTGIGARYDAAYFERWYRSPRTRVKTATELKRQAAFVLHMTEWTLGRSVRTVLDVGCGEGQWKGALERIRPSISYTGVDPSTYAVSRYGRRRHILLGSIETLDALPLAPAYDLVVCCGMLNYLSSAQFRRGVQAVARHTDGVAYLEIFADGDAIEGDVTWPTPRPARWYRQAIARTGLTSVGMQCWVPEQVANIVAMERG